MKMPRLVSTTNTAYRTTPSTSGRNVSLSGYVANEHTLIPINLSLTEAISQAMRISDSHTANFNSRGSEAPVTIIDLEQNPYNASWTATTRLSDGPYNQTCRTLVTEEGVFVEDDCTR